MFPDEMLPETAPKAGSPYLVLARKYRPQSFASLIGQEAMVQTLRNAFKSGRIAPRLHPHRRARRGQDDHRPHPCPRFQLRADRDGASRRAVASILKVKASTAVPSSRAGTWT
jgi:hypothetical protein